MEWNYGGGFDDLVVPKDQELFDRLPSPESWSKWGLNMPESFEYPRKYSSIDSNSSQEELNFIGEMSCNESEIESCTRDKYQSSGIAAGGVLSKESFDKTASSEDLPDYRIDGFAAFELPGDIFLDPILDDVLSTENIHKSFCFSPELESGVLSSQNLLHDISFDSRSTSNDAYSTGSSKFLKRHAFSPSLGWEQTEVAAPKFTSSKLEQKPLTRFKALPVKGLLASECYCNSGCYDKESSVEESVLQELETVMVQLTGKTRIHFRDALYRLANNSKEDAMMENQNADLPFESPPWAGVDEKMRTQTREAETNAFDRTIANLLFNKMDLNARDFPISASSDFKQELVGESGQPNYNLNQLQMMIPSHHPTFPGDAEVPFFGQQYAKRLAIEANVTV